MSQVLYYLVPFTVLLGLLIVAHELGHYLAARWLGVKVLRFSVGFGRPLWMKRLGKDATEWAIAAFPLGGYVKMLDEQEGEVAPEDLPRSFNRQSVGRRMLIVAAGPFANLVLAVFVHWALFWHGVEEPRPILGPPIAASPAAAAGLENGERVLKVGKETVETWPEMRWKLLRKAAEQEYVELELINPRQEIVLRRIDVAVLKENGWEGDALEKLGIRSFRPRIPPIIGRVDPGSPAEAAGLRPGDELRSIGGKPVSDGEQVAQVVGRSPQIALDVELWRDGENLSLTLTPVAKEDKGQRIGRIGVMFKNPGIARSDLLVEVSYGPWKSFGKAVFETWDKSAFSLRMIGKMIVGEVSWRNISGPVTIAEYAGQSAQMGLSHYLKFLALISISLAVLNLLPIPVLDGGHLLYYFAEVIRGKPLSEHSLEIGQRVGLSLLFLLMVFAFFNDFNRLISGG